MITKADYEKERFGRYLPWESSRTDTDVGDVPITTWGPSKNLPLFRFTVNDVDRAVTVSLPEKYFGGDNSTFHPARVNWACWGNQPPDVAGAMARALAMAVKTASRLNARFASVTGLTPR